MIKSPEKHKSKQHKQN